MRRLVTRAAVGAVLLGFAAASKAQPGQKIERVPPPATQAVSAPLPVGIEADVYCSGWVGEPNERFPGSVTSAERVDNQRSYIQGDILYLDIGTNDGVEAGQEFWLVRPSRAVYRWGSVLDVLGRVYETPGRVRVICAQQKASIAEIVLSCSDAEVGNFVLPFEPVPIPLVRRTRPLTSCDAPTEKPTGHIVDVRGAITPLSTDTVVFLDLGEKDGLNPGDFLTVYRTAPSSFASKYGEGHRHADVRTILGEVAILTTKTNTSVGIITSMKDTMAVGDSVEVK
jgi:hypothetical protein